jgi:toxin CcdB
MVTQFMSAVATAELGPAVADLDVHHDEILAALDMMFVGF